MNNVVLMFSPADEKSLKTFRGMDKAWKSIKGFIVSLPADVRWGSFVTHSFLPHFLYCELYV